MRVYKQKLEQRYKQILNWAGKIREVQKSVEDDWRRLKFYSQFIKRDDVCFDIGANIGNRTKIFLKLGAKVVAVEPQDKCIEQLQKSYGKNNKITILQKVLGASEGEADLMISNADTLSSLSTEWIEAVKKSGRFSTFMWEEKQVVQMTTLDKLISKYGFPSFIKIDVEGFEYEVIKGLSQPVEVLSLEFAPEFIYTALMCIKHLQALGDIKLNYSLGEEMQLVLVEWTTAQGMIEILTKLEQSNRIFGDIYIKFKN